MKIPLSSLHQPTHTRRALIAAALALPLCPLARADYASEILSDQPIMYYRFDDGVATDDVSTPETNLGSLGAAGNGVLSDSIVRQAPGALSGSADVSAKVVGTGMSVPFNAALNNQGSFQCGNLAETIPRRHPRIPESFFLMAGKYRHLRSRGLAHLSGCCRRRFQFPHLQQERRHHGGQHQLRPRHRCRSMASCCRHLGQRGFDRENLCQWRVESDQSGDCARRNQQPDL